MSYILCASQRGVYGVRSTDLDELPAQKRFNYGNRADTQAHMEQLRKKQVCWHVLLHIRSMMKYPMVQVRTVISQTKTAPLLLLKLQLIKKTMNKMH